MTITDTALPLFLLPFPLLIALVAGVCVGGAVLAWAVLTAMLRLGPGWAPQPPFHAAILGLFALMLSFSVNDAWRRSDGAFAALLRESQELAGLLPLLDAVQPFSPALAHSVRQGLRTYLDVSLREEWGGQNTAASAAAGAALDGVREVITAGLASPGERAAIWRLMQDRLDGVQQGRSARLVAGGLYGDALRWGTLLVLYVVGAFAVVAVHLERRRAMATALVIYICAATAALSLVSLSEHPYAGWDAIEPQRLVVLAARLG